MGIFKKTPKQVVEATGEKVIELRERLEGTDCRDTAKRKKLEHALAIAELHYAVAQKDWDIEAAERIAAARRAPSATKSNKNSNNPKITTTVSTEVNKFGNYYALNGPLLGTPVPPQPSATRKKPSVREKTAPAKNFKKRTTPKSKKR